ncbi:hypothetical protein ACFQQB_00835 [Nonomuraea rubra]|uniref:hypothetical protein n=1 Tax=Nonomuraea rubra TaxID=46180 RepID=UPI003606FE1D
MAGDTPGGARRPPAHRSPLVALHQATAGILQIKPAWRFTLARQVPLSAEAQAVQAEVMALCEEVFGKLLGPGTDLVWARQVYLALLGEAAHGTPPAGRNPDAPGAPQPAGILTRPALPRPVRTLTRSPRR